MSGNAAPTRWVFRAPESAAARVSNIVNVCPRRAGHFFAGHHFCTDSSAHCGVLSAWQMLQLFGAPFLIVSDGGMKSNVWLRASPMLAEESEPFAEDLPLLMPAG